MATSKFISAERLRELLAYEPESGLFTWMCNRAGRKFAGTIAGSKNKKGYTEITVDGGRYWAHRLAWLHVHGVMPTGDIDHINGDRSDNRIANLRDVAHIVNAQNRTRTNRSNKSGVLGVWLHQRGGSWGACIQAAGVRHHIGYYPTKEEARAAYLAAKSELHQGA